MQETSEKWARIVVQAWVDEGFKNRLLADPKSVLKENGIDFPERIKVNISEDRDDEINLILPPKPDISCGEEWLLSGPWRHVYGADFRIP
jgi:hypothetical protein